MIDTTWSRQRVGDLIDGLTAGVSVRSIVGRARHVPAVLKTSSVNRAAFLPNESKPIHPADTGRARCNPIADSVIISRMNTPELVGEVGYVATTYLNLFLPDRLWLARSKRGVAVDMHWLALYLASEHGAKQLRGLATGTSGSMKNIPKNRVLDLEIDVPGAQEQRSISSALADADDLIALLERQIAKKHAVKQGMMQQLLTGRTRLPGFTGAWEWRPFMDVMTRINAKRFQVPAHAYRSAGRLPVVDQGQRAVVGYTDDVSIAFDPGTDGVIVFGDHTCITKFVNFMFAVGADGTQILKAKPGNSTRFMASALEASPVTSTGYNRHFKHLKEKVLPAPPLAEQDAIVEALADIDTVIDSLNVRLARARRVKQGMMQELLTGRTRLPIKEVTP